jgi:hypothetical protein
MPLLAVKPPPAVIVSLDKRLATVIPVTNEAVAISVPVTEPADNAPVNAVPVALYPNILS